jgi:VWFA-related protein
MKTPTMSKRFVIIPVVVALIALVAERPALSRQPASQRPKFGTSTAAVLVDVVVRDKKGKPVTGLTAEDFQVFEDGVPQKIISCDAAGLLAPLAQPVQVAQPAQPVTPGAPAPAPAAQPEAGQTVVALVFDWLSEQSRAEAYKAARTLVDDMKAGDFAGVFSIDQSLHRIVPFTSNTTALSAGFELVLTRPRPSTARVQGALANALLSRPETAPTASAEDPGTPAAANPANAADPSQPPASASAAADAQFAAELQSIDDFDRYANKEIQATAASDSLRGLVQLLAPLPGRKTVVLFSEGLQITNSTVERWGRLTDEANRQNVSFYTFDAQGLKVLSDQAAMGRMLGPSFGTGFSRGLYGDNLEQRNEALLNGTTHGLAELASSTGGQYISNTNNLAGAFARVNEDRRSYYMLSYSSTNPTLDGKFRSITVKVLRQGLTVHARRGYVASPTIEHVETREYETAAAAVLSEHPTPRAFPFQLQAFSTPMPGRPGLISLVASVPSGVLSYTEDSATSRFKGQATILAQLSSHGEVVAHQSQHYDLSGDLAHLAQTREGRILFFASPEVPAGRTQIDWVVRDDEAGHASVAQSMMDVPEPGTLMVGDLFLVSRTERAPKDKSVERNPLAWQGLLLYPSFGEPVSRAKTPDISFAIPIVLDPKDAVPPASVRLLVNGKAVAELPFALGTPQKDGRLVAVGRLPLNAVPAGIYTLQVTIGAGATAQAREAALTVEP